MTEPLTILLAAIPSLAKAGADIAASSDEAKRNTQLIEFQRVIIQLQSSIAAIQNQNASLLRDKDDLEKKIVSMKNWDAEKQRYALVTVFDGITVYALKESVSQGEAPHHLCTNCFNNGKKSFLNTVDGARGFSMLTCSVCKSQLQSPYRGMLSAQYAPS
jgi:hypothetical protein